MAQVITPREGEEILLRERKSFSVKSKQVFWFLLLLMPAILLLVFVSNVYTSVFALILILAATIYGLYHFIVWYYDLYLITNMRIIIVSQKGLFTRELSEVEMADVADVKYRISGIIATILQRGTVVVTAMTGQTYELENVSDPDEIKEMITTVVATLRNHQKAS